MTLRASTLLRPQVRPAAPLGGAAVLAACLVFAAGCSPGNKSNDTASVDKTGEDGGDNQDLGGAQPVPMALMGDDFLASASGALGQSIAFGSYADLDSGSMPKRDGSAAPVPSSSQELPYGILETPSRAAGEMRRLVDVLDQTYASLFLSGGLFAGKQVDVRVHKTSGSGSRLFQLKPAAAGQTSPDLAEVVINPEAAAYRYTVNVYRLRADSQYAKQSVFEFTPDAQSPDVAKAIHVLNFVALSPTSTQILDATYVPSAKSLSAAFGNSPATADIPAKTLVLLTLGPAPDALAVAGAYVWKRDGVTLPAGSLSERYAYLQTGDVELFNARGKTGGERPTEQEVAFVPAEESAAVGTKPGNAVFTSNAYPRFTMSFLTSLIRLGSINAQCATTGSAFQQAFQGHTVPSSVAGAPNDLCKSSTSTSDPLDQVVASMVADTCQANISIVLPVTLANGGAVDYQICQKYTDALLLKNPQYLLYNADTNGVTVIPAAQANADHQQLKAALDADQTFIDYTALGDLTWPAVETVSQDKAKTAEAGP